MREENERWYKIKENTIYLFKNIVRFVCMAATLAEASTTTHGGSKASKLN